MKEIRLGLNELFGPWICKKLGTEWQPHGSHCLGMVENEEIVVGVLFNLYNEASICIHVAAAPGKLWANREFLWYAFAYPFLQLRVNKVIGPVASTDKMVRRFDERLGFVLEATLKDAHPKGDLCLYTMTRQQCRWLDPEEKVSYGLRKVKNP